MTFNGKLLELCESQARSLIISILVNEAIEIMLRVLRVSKANHDPDFDLA